jgi:hypothetical protein
VYASTGLFGFGLLSSSCNTRYGWLVRPYPAGTLTLQEDAKLTLALLTSGVSGRAPSTRRCRMNSASHASLHARVRLGLVHETDHFSFGSSTLFANRVNTVFSSMPMYTANHLSLRFGLFPLFERYQIARYENLLRLRISIPSS